ncbi:hypothetical protein POTOM_035974 [Populus tomentosa]|uniref:CRAL-TRIO domain-containing protein n=1 Tax=Populus tomentosa TaxID=118781 RepID=A0A8X7YV83_POPTO|nr:hypothetical protein POTOM_035974 [Populus tomentosa]
MQHAMPTLLSFSGLCCFLSTGTLFHMLFALFSLRGKYYYTKALKFEPVLSWSQFEAAADRLSLMDKTQQEVALTQLRKSVQKLGSSTDKYGDPTLMRFLISRSMDPAKAAKLLVEWQKWRASFVPNGSIPDSEVEDEMGPRKVFLHGLSKDGYPVLLVKANKHFPSKDRLQFKKFVVHLLDKTIARQLGQGLAEGVPSPCVRNMSVQMKVMIFLDEDSFKGREIGNEKLIAILDLQHMSYKNIDARGMITAFQLLQIVIVNNDEERKCFVKEIGEKVLPEELGGRATLVALQDVTVPPLEG